MYGGHDNICTYVREQCDEFGVIILTSIIL